MQSSERWTANAAFLSNIKRLLSMHDVHTLQNHIDSHAQSTFHTSDYLAMILAFTPSLFAYLNDHSGLFVAITALLGGAFTVYRFCTVYVDRKKARKKEEELLDIIHGKFQKGSK